MNEFGRGLLVLFGCASMAGACATAGVPSESPVAAAAPVIINVPKDLEGTDRPLKGVQFNSIDRLMEQEDVIGHSTANTIKDFFSVTFADGISGQLTTEACRGEHYQDGKRLKSCVAYDAQVTVSEQPDQFRIEITPVKMRTVQGRNPFGLPIKMPRMTLEDWYGYVSAQTVVSHQKITSKFGPESIKGNFDRRLKRRALEEGEANAALRQFKDTYVIEGKDGTATLVGASFFPYRDGALVELYLVGNTTDKTAGPQARDWNAAVASVKKELENVANE
jgi:hypothetical protein